jgi:molybdopterin-binding protein
MSMETLDVEAAARLLHVNAKRVQAMARQGKLPAARVGRKWLFRRGDLEALLGRAVAVADTTRPLELSARNRLRGRVTQLLIDGLMAEVHLAIGDQELVSLITRSSAERMGLKVGDSALAVIKSTEVMIGKDGDA